MRASLPLAGFTCNKSSVGCRNDYYMGKEVSIKVWPALLSK